MNNIAEARRLSPAVRTAVTVFQETYNSIEGPFAIADALAAVRRRYPANNLSNNELTRAIAEDAAATQASIQFDDVFQAGNSSMADNPNEHSSDNDPISPDVRAAIAAFLQACQKEAEPFAAAEALGAVRQIFPMLDINDDALTDAIVSEANAAGFDIEYDASGSPQQLKRKALERWENEGGAGR